MCLKTQTQLNCYSNTHFPKAKYVGGRNQETTYKRGQNTLKYHIDIDTTIDEILEPRLPVKKHSLQMDIEWSGF